VMGTQSCGACWHFEVLPDKDGKRRMRADRSYRCLAPIPAPVLPDSATTAYGFRWPLQGKGRAMERHEGSDCPTFLPRAIIND
jgi:hypothetical protein